MAGVQPTVGGASCASSKSEVPQAEKTARTSSRSRRPSTRASPLGGIFSLEVVEARPGFKVLRVLGDGADVLFRDEAGGHRWQHVPNTEKGGRVHTSLITVAVLAEPTETQVVVNESDLEITCCRGSGAGGQHRNVTASAVQITHLPTKLQVRCESERSQWQNKQTALALLRARLWERQHEADVNGRAEERREQVGMGTRCEKRRTIRVKDGRVVDHVTGRKWRFSDYLKGEGW